MKSAFTIALRLEPRFSKYFATVLTILYGGAFGLLFPLSIPLLWKCLVAIALLINLIYTLYRHLLYIRHPLYGAVLQYHTVWLADGQEALIEPSSYSHPLGIVLKASLNKHSLCPLIIFPDSLDENTFRRLRVRLRHGYHDEYTIG